MKTWFIPWVLVVGAIASLPAATSRGSDRLTWYIYGAAQLSDQKTLVFTRMLPVAIGKEAAATASAQAELARAQLQRQLTEHISSRMYRDVAAVTVVCRADRTGIRDERDAEINAKKAAGQRIIFLNGFVFSFDEKKSVP